MQTEQPRVTIHMAASLDGFIARRDGGVDWLGIWFVGGGEVSAECLRLQLADEVRYSIVPILIGDGISFFQGLDKDVALHLLEATAYTNGMVALRYEVRKEARPRRARST
jgi:dihydrofolate reductase